MRIPKIDERVEIQVVGLPEGLLSGVLLSFSIDRRGGRTVIHIPGHNRGPDNCTPHNTEQAEWLNGLKSLLYPSWDCQWTLNLSEPAGPSACGLQDLDRLNHKYPGRGPWAGVFPCNAKNPSVRPDHLLKNEFSAMNLRRIFLKTVAYYR